MIATDGPLMVFELEEFRFLQHLAWMGSVYVSGMNDQDFQIAGRLMRQRVAVIRGPRLCASERGWRAVLVRRVHQSASAVALLRKDVDDDWGYDRWNNPVPDPLDVYL